MKSARREVLKLAVGAAALPGFSGFASAQDYPVRPVRLIVGFPAGGGQDIGARMIGQWLTERVGQPFVVENRPGAATNLATEAIVRATPDGYTLGIVGASAAIGATLYEKLNFNLIRDIAPVAGISREPNILVVNPSVPTKTVSEFIAYAKANPGKINMASGGNGSTPHVAGELFKMMTGINMLHVPYRGGAPALADLLAGQVHVMFATVSSSIEHIRTGKLRALAVTTSTRSEALPEIPTLHDFVPGYEASAWYGIGAPKDTPSAVVEALNKQINAGLADFKIKSRLADLGGAPLPMAPADFGKLIAEEVEKWARVIKFAGVRAD